MKILVKNQTNKYVKILKTDNYLKFCNSKFNNFGKFSGLNRYKTIKHTPQYNCVAKIMDMTLLHKVKCMLVPSSLLILFGENVL